MKSSSLSLRKISLFCLAMSLATMLGDMLLTVLPVAAFEDNPTGASVRVEARGNGWDVHVKFHVRKVAITPVKFTGKSGATTATYPQPSIVEYNFEVDNDLCGGDFNPVTKTYQYPNAGQAVIEIFFPEGTFADPDLPDISEITVIRRSPCGEDGPVNFIPEPLIEVGDVSGIAKSIWERIELPELEVSANPKTGIVTVPAWFWLTIKQNRAWWPGTNPEEDGQPFGVTVTIPLPGQTHTVQVLVDVTKVLWDFADFNNNKRFMLTTFVGKQFPKKSNVTHFYNNEWIYFPQTTLTFVPRYAWNSGGWTALPDQFRQTLALGEHRVREAQTVLVEPGTSKR